MQSEVAGAWNTRVAPRHLATPSPFPPAPYPTPRKQGKKFEWKKEKKKKNDRSITTAGETSNKSVPSGLNLPLNFVDIPAQLLGDELLPIHRQAGERFAQVPVHHVLHRNVVGSVLQMVSTDNGRPHPPLVSYASRGGKRTQRRLRPGKASRHPEHPTRWRTQWPPICLARATPCAYS